MEGDLTTVGRDHPIWLDDGSPFAASKDNLQEGRCAIGTVNPNDWPGGREFMQSSAADVLLVQEAKVREGEAIDQAEQSARHFK